MMWPFAKKKKAEKKGADVNGQDSEVDPKAKTQKIDLLDDPRQEDTAVLEQSCKETAATYERAKSSVFKRSDTVQRRLEDLKQKKSDTKKTEKTEKE
jgi:hypothetical protein